MVSAAWPPSLSNSPTASGSAVFRAGLMRSWNEAKKLSLTAGSATRSCGRRGPARLGWIVAKDQTVDGREVGVLGGPRRQVRSGRFSSHRAPSQRSGRISTQPVPPPHAVGIFDAEIFGAPRLAPQRLAK